VSELQIPHPGRWMIEAWSVLSDLEPTVRTRVALRTCTCTKDAELMERVDRSRAVVLGLEDLGSTIELYPR
jgi:hypothetical protein